MQTQPNAPRQKEGTVIQKKANVMCLDCQSIFENKKDSQNAMSPIFQHLISKNHNQIKIQSDSNKTEHLVILCKNCGLRNAFNLRIYRMFGINILLCDLCSNNRQTIIQTINHKLSGFHQANFERVVQKQAINSILVNQNVQQLLKPQQPNSNSQKESQQTKQSNQHKTSNNQQQAQQNQPQNNQSYSTSHQQNQQKQNNQAINSNTKKEQSGSDKNLKNQKQTKNQKYITIYERADQQSNQQYFKKQNNNFSQSQQNNVNNAQKQNNTPKVQQANNNPNKFEYVEKNQQQQQYMKADKGQPQSQASKDIVQQVNTSVKCLKCLNIFKNERKNIFQVTEIVRHLKKNNHSEIEICSESKKTKLQRFKCLCCSGRNIFVLLVVDVGQFNLVICKECLQKKEINIKNPQTQICDIIQLSSCQSTPVIIDGSINSLLMNISIKQNDEKYLNELQNLKNFEDRQPDLLHQVENEDADDISFDFIDNEDEQRSVQLNKFQGQNIPYQFKSYKDYQIFFKDLLGIESKESKRQIETFGFEADITISSKANQSKCEITINYPEQSIANTIVKEGAELDLKTKSFNEQCFVGKVENTKAIAFSQKNSLTQNTQVIKNVQVRSVYPKVIFDRIHSGVNQLQHVYKTLKEQILGSKPLNKQQEKFESSDSLEIIDDQQSHYSRLNKSQRKAIFSYNQRISLIQGPPGTGKTETAAHLVVNLCQENSNQKILVCAPSNLASDNIANRIHEIDSQINIYRVVSLSRQRQKVEYKYDDIVLHYHLDKEQNRRKEAERLLDYAQVICTTCINSVDVFLKKYTFRTVIIDESNQAIEPECLIPLQHNAKNLILVGDHKQLQPIITSTIASKKGLKRSMFSRLVQLGHIPYFLNMQYRMHPAIANISSTIFYSGKLQNGVTEKQRKPNKGFNWINKKIPLQFYNIQGQETTLQDGRSFLNYDEADQVLKLVKELKRAGVNSADIGIITAYTSQSVIIKNYVDDKNILIDTSYSFQGKEKEYIILSCVRSNSFKCLGIMGNPQLINVSITRAKRGLLIVGNKNHLMVSKWWKRVLEMFEKDNLFIDVHMQSPSKLKSIDQSKGILVSDDPNITFSPKQ